MKTVSDITASDILATYKPSMPTQAIVDTQILPVEQIVILKAADGNSIPENAFIVIARDGRRYLECDATSTNWNGTAMIINQPHPYHITEVQFRFLVKNILSSIGDDDYSYEAVCHSVSYQFEIARVRGIGAPGPCSFCIPAEGVKYRNYLRDVITSIQAENASSAGGTGN